MIQWTDNGVIIDSIDQMPEGVFGFIYKTTTDDGRIYIGKKQTSSTKKKHMSKKELAARPPRKRRTWYWKTTEMKGWREYFGSSDPLKEAVADGMGYRKEIIHYCFSKKQLSYYELKYQMKHEVIEPGNDSWNASVAGKYYRKDLLNDTDEV